MVQLTNDQISAKMKFIKNYISSNNNAATDAKLDANANITTKNVSTLQGQLYKDFSIQLNRAIIKDRLKSRFDESLAEEYVRQIENHEIYVHDETHPAFPYCVAINLYPLLLNGMKALGGESGPPKHLSSFCGQLVNLIFAVSSQFSGAVAIAEALIYFDYFARKDYGNKYLEKNKHEIETAFSQIVYSINEPAGARDFQSVFANFSIFDKYYFESLFENFYFPDGTQSSWDSVSKLQKTFMRWFNKERERALLTFPVVSASLFIDENDKTIKDREYREFIAKEFSEGNSFFIYMSSSIDSLSSCCRLRSAIKTNTFSYTLGGVGVATGSKNVITLNINRLIQDGRDLKTEIQKIHKYQMAFEDFYQELFAQEMLTIYKEGYISLDKQYLTIGINGIVEAAEYLGLDPSNNDEYKDFLKNTLKVFMDENKKAGQEYGVMFNTEFVPAENLGVKNAIWDKADGYEVSRDCYNSYFYPVEDTKMTIFDKMDLYSEDIVQYLDGGSALHLNLDELLASGQWSVILDIAASKGVNYFTYNTRNTCCEETSCGHIDKKTLDKCPKCGSENISHATRIIGYLKKENHFSKDRQEEAKLRHYHTNN